MPQLSSADQQHTPPHVIIPRDYNAAWDLLQRNLQAGRGAKTAFIDDRGSLTYGELAERVNRFGNVLVGLGVAPESRILLCLHDTVDFPVAFLGAIQAGIVPVATNTLLTSNDYDYMLGDARVRVLVVSAALWPQFASIVGKHKQLKHVIVSGADASALSEGQLRLSEVLAQSAPHFEPAPTTADDMCFWLYSSGSTGAPKGTVHLHSHLIQTAELYARPILGIEESDVVFSAAKLFFAYGLGNGLTFPMSVGATAVLMGERPTPQAVFQRFKQHHPTIFYGVPTLYAAMLASAELPARADLHLRLCTSAGEALPADIGRRWTEHFGVEVLDGIGSTEMLHIFLSNRPGEVRYGTTGKAVPGYALRLIGEDGNVVEQGAIGELQISGPTAAVMYWNNRERSRNTFLGPWTRSGDKYTEDEDGYYHYAGRSDDMLKVSGIYVSPFEVEAALMTHEAVLEAAVVGCADIDELIKPKAYVVLKSGIVRTPELAEQLKQHVKNQLAPYKYPRWLEFSDELPKTATGKIQRFKLRQT